MCIGCRVLGCNVLGHCLEQLAVEYPHVKFLSMRATDCIPGYPDTNLPTVLVYHDGQCARTLVGLAPFGGSRLTPESAPPAPHQRRLWSPRSGSGAQGVFRTVGSHGQHRLARLFVPQWSPGMCETWSWQS